MSKHFWLGFEKYIKNKFPSYIKNILVNSGYDNELSISKLNNESINDIEIFVTANRNLLKNSIYEKSSEKKFSFLPGHRHLLLDLPNQLRDFKNSKFINNGLNKNQTFACFFTNNPMAFHENGTPRTDFRPSCNNQFSEQFPDEGLYMVKLKRFQSKFVK